MMLMLLLDDHVGHPKLRNCNVLNGSIVQILCLMRFLLLIHSMSAHSIAD